MCSQEAPGLITADYPRLQPHHHHQAIAQLAHAKFVVVSGNAKKRIAGFTGTDVDQHVGIIRRPTYPLCLRPSSRVDRDMGRWRWQSSHRYHLTRRSGRADSLRARLHQLVAFSSAARRSPQVVSTVDPWEVVASPPMPITRPPTLAVAL